jgi:hypothetical protein
LELTPVKVVDEVRKTVWRNYLEATIKREATRDEIIRSSPASPVIRRFGEESVFVSDELKHTLQLVEGQKLSFSLGLSLFA